MRLSDLGAAMIDATGDKTALSLDELELLETKILPTARRWLGFPELRIHGERTLAYWGEFIEQMEAAE